MNTRLDIYRPGTPAVLQEVIEIDIRTEFSKKLMGDHTITAQFYTDTPISVQLGDYIIYNNEQFYINRVPSMKKIKSDAFEYTIVFCGEVHELEKKLFISSDGLTDFSYTGTANDFLDLVIQNMNTYSTGWHIGVVATTEERTLEFSGDYCRGALTRIAEEFKLEYEINDKTIDLTTSVGQVRAYAFEYGKGNGLYNIERQHVRDQNIVTKVYGFGGVKNIPFGYRSRAKRLVFEERFLTANTDLYGVVEGVYKNEEIYPKRTSTLTAVHIQFNTGKDGTEFNNRTSYIEDSTLDFDINDYLIDGETAKIVFKSGDMSGVECEIWKYDAAQKRFYFNEYVDSDGYKQPSYNTGATIQPRTGDSYTLVNISLPQSYIDAAEAELRSLTQTYIDENSVPQVVYTGNIDPKYARENGVSLRCGDKVTVIDADLGVNTLIRIAGITFPLVNPYKLNLTIADFVPYTIQERIIKTAVAAKKETVYIQRRNTELIRRNVMRQEQLKGLIFDTDGYFDPSNIKPLSIETTYLSVGAKSQNFALNGVSIQPNYNGDANSLYVSPGMLIHYAVDFQGPFNDEWTIPNPGVWNDLTPTVAYYLYGRCSKTSPDGSWYLTNVRLFADGTDGYYYFLCGILYTVYNGARDYDFTYGITYINGRVITTGRIRSVDGQNYFDLDQNQFYIGDDNHSLDWNVTNPGMLTLKGAMVQSPSGEPGSIPVYRGVWASNSTYYYGEQVTYNNAVWTYKNATPSAGNVPQDGNFWMLFVQSGANGISIVWKGEFATEAALISALGQPQAGWAYHNTTAKASFCYSGSSWTKMSEDGAPGEQGPVGAGYFFAGEASVPNVAWQILNYCYRDTDNGVVYVWNGTTWTLMLQDGNDGTPGTNGTNGNGVFITYHNNPISVAPATPTGDGTAGGWHTAPSVAANWMSQKVAPNASSGQWGSPLCITGADGSNGLNGTNGINSYLHIAYANDQLGTGFSKTNANGKAYMGTYTDSSPVGSDSYAAYTWILVKGADGANGPMINLRGTFSALTPYFNTSIVRDVVKYIDAYYLFKGATGTSGAWDVNNWEPFGSSWSSVATGLLLAEMSTIENLYVQDFHGIAVPVGDFDGTEGIIQSNIAPIARVDTFTKSTDPTDTPVTLNGYMYTMVWNTNKAVTVGNFVSQYANSFGNLTLTNMGNGVFTATANVPGVDFYGSTGFPGGTVVTTIANNPGAKQKYEIIFSGSSGRLMLQCNGVSKEMDWFGEQLYAAIDAFIAVYGAIFTAAGANLIRVGDRLYVESTAAGVPLTGMNIYNVPNGYRGSLKIHGNEMWEDSEANSTYGSLMVNRKGYKGGDLYYRDFFVGNGKGEMIISLYGNATGNSCLINATRVLMGNIPASAAAAATGELYKENGYIKYKI
jgi:hypothetical protein